MHWTRLLVCVAGVTVAVGCGGRTLTGSGSDAQTNANGNSNTNHQADGGVGLCVDRQCVIGIRTDNCCEAAFATTVAEVESDECLERWPLLWERIPQTCLDAWDPQCDYIDCMPGPPQYRIAACSAPDGICEMVPECASPTDCVLAMDHRKCCPCPEAVPPALIESDPCITAHPGGVTGVPTTCFPQMCPEMPCAQCNEDPPKCTDGVCWNDNPGW